MVKTKKINLKEITTQDIINLSKKRNGKIDIQEALILFFERKKAIENNSKKL